MLRWPKDARVDADQARRQVGAVHPVAHLEGDLDLPVGHAQVAAQPAQHRQLGADRLDAVLLQEGALEAVEVARVVGQRGRLDVEVDHAHGRVLPPVAGERQGLGLGDGVTTRPVPLFLLRRHGDHDIALDDGKAGEGEALGHLLRAEVHARAALDAVALDPDLAAAAAALAAAGRVDLDAGFGGDVEQRRAAPGLDGEAARQKGDARGRRRRGVRRAAGLVPRLPRAGRARLAHPFVLRDPARRS